MTAIIAAILLVFAPHYLDAASAQDHADAAISAEVDTGLPATLLLAVAWHETRFDALSLSRWQDDAGKRVAAHYAGEHPPPGARAHSWFCGPLQSGWDLSWGECRHRRDDLAYGYLTGAREILGWMGCRECRRAAGDDKVLCGLRHYNGGNRPGPKATGYARAVMGTAGVLRKHLQIALAII
jgi:hypothetical protein